MSTANDSIQPRDTFWRRWMSRIVAFEEAMEMRYDDIQDRRMDRIEAELVRLRAEVAATAMLSNKM